jgi:hypothetical protein
MVIQKGIGSKLLRITRDFWSVDEDAGGARLPSKD